MNARRRKQVEAAREQLRDALALIALLEKARETINKLADEEFKAHLRKAAATVEGRALNEAERECRKAIAALRALAGALDTAARDPRESH